MAGNNGNLFSHSPEVQTQGAGRAGLEGRRLPCPYPHLSWWQASLEGPGLAATSPQSLPASNLASPLQTFLSLLGALPTPVGLQLNQLRRQQPYFQRSSHSAVLGRTQVWGERCPQEGQHAQKAGRRKGKPGHRKRLERRRASRA